MKKSIIIFFVLGFWSVANAQFSVSSSSEYVQIDDNLTDIDAVFLFNGISPATEISYTGAGTVEWREYNNSFVANTNYFSPDDATGYVLYINGTPTYWLWVIDYSLYTVTLSDLSIAQIEQDFCENISLTANTVVPELIYYDKNNIKKTLTRSFSLDYVDYEFVGDNWQDKEVTIDNINSLALQFTVPAPKQDVTFTLSGDNFAKQMGIETKIYLDYTAVAVESHLTGTVIKRSVPPTDKPNEKDRDKSSGNLISGSGPLDVEFKSRANTPVAAYFEWVIYPEKTPLSTHRYPDENIRYTFINEGSYWVKLTVTSRGACVYKDSIQVIVIKSFIEVPNAFSPNNDGYNDEFRVAYSSLKTYKCVVYNRWGNVVFTSTDPNKGWDGKIHGKEAAEGTYYYIINAIGTDIEEDKSSKNKGKQKKYSKSGAVNLFR